MEDLSFHANANFKAFPHSRMPSGSATRLWTDPSFGGNPGTGTGPPIKTFGADALGITIPLLPHAIFEGEL
jgi:hypothetical protein